LWEVKSLEPTFLPKFGRPVMFVINHVTFRVYVITREREQNNRSEEAKTERFWEVKSLEPTFLPKFGRTVMFVIDHMPFWVYVITEKGNKIKGLRKQKDFGK